MNIRLHQATTALLTGLLLIGGNALAEDKKEPIKMIKVERVKKIAFDDPNHIYIFVSPLRLAGGEKNKDETNKTGTNIVKNTQDKQGENTAPNSVRIYCRRSDLEGDYKGSKPLEFNNSVPTDLLLPCDTSRFIAREEAAISVIYVDVPTDSKEIKAARKEVETAKKDMEEAKKNEIRAQALENAQTKSNKGNDSPSLLTELLEIKNKTKLAKMNAEILEGKSELADIELNKLIKASTATTGDKYCNESFELPSLISFTETTRDTLFMLQVKQILSKAKETISSQKKQSKDPEETKPDTICAWNWAEYKLTKDRAVVNAEAINPVKTESTISFNVITGGKEHFFLSVDAIFKDVKQLRAAAKSKDDIQGKPERVFLSLNYMVGDVYGTLPTFDHRRLVLKGLITPNQQIDSYGVGLGYRLPGLFSTSKIDSEEHSGLVVFVGRFWTRPAKSPLDIPNTDSRRIASTSVGISYSLGAALDWLVPKK